MFVCDGLYAVVYLKPKQLIIKDCARRFVLKLCSHEASRGLFATAELLVLYGLEACAIWKTDLNSLDFVVNRFFMKLFHTSSVDRQTMSDVFLF